MEETIKNLEARMAVMDALYFGVVRHLVEESTQRKLLQGVLDAERENFKEQIAVFTKPSE